MVHATVPPRVSPTADTDLQIRSAHADVRARHERWLLAARGFSAVLFTAFARRMRPEFSHPPDPRDPNTWRELCRGLDAEDEHGDSLVIACAGMVASLDAPLAALRRVCAATHRAAWYAWPRPHDAEFPDRSALRTDDAVLAASLASAAAAVPARAVPLLSGDALLARALHLLASELVVSRIAITRVELFEDDDGVLAKAASDLLAAEWALWTAGQETAASRVGLARAVIGTAVAGVWSRLGVTSEHSARAAVAALALLKTGRDTVVCPAVPDHRGTAAGL